MSRLEIVLIPNGQFVQNCYLVADAEQKVAVMVDPGEESGRILSELGRRNWTLQAIWLTHAHIDHILGVEAVHAAHAVPIHLHPADLPLYLGVAEQASWMGFEVRTKPPRPDRELFPGETLNVGGVSFAVRHVPGHSPGHVAFVGNGVILGGDVLFSGSIGRTDLPGGDTATLMQSIHAEFLTLPDSTVVYSGHGPATTIGVERETNPFLMAVGR